MQYISVDELPSGLRSSLPLEAQEVYVRVYNEQLSKQSEDDYAHSVAHKHAWSEVKKRYEHLGEDGWQAKEVRGTDGKT